MAKRMLFSARELFDDYLEMELRRCVRYQNYTALLLAEMTSSDPRVFQVNNAQTVDKLCSLIRKELRDSDVVCNFGGDVISIVLLYSDKSIAEKVGNRLLSWISDYLSRQREQSTSYLCIGGACFPSDATDLSSLCQHAQSMFEKAKGFGVSRVQLAHREAVWP
jgi:diguanylate cyclase (GGDEF)-like protein